MADMIAGYFVYVRGLRGPAPQKWPIDRPLMGGELTLAEWELTQAEMALPIDVLAKRYRYVEHAT